MTVSRWLLGSVNRWLNNEYLSLKYIFMSDLESSEKSNWGKRIAVLTTAGALAGSWFGAEKIAELVIGDYEGSQPSAPQVPGLPEKPEPAPAKRNAIEVAIGFDVSKSDIRNKLPAVVSETREFLDHTGVLQDGDTVSICKFVEKAECREFQLPDQKPALISYVDGIKLDPRKPNEMHTYVHASVKQILDQTGADMVFAWTDGFDEDQDSRQELGADHSPVVIVVPDSKYVADANSVKQTLGSSGVDVKVAATSEEFGKDLENFTGELNAEAQVKAEQDAEKLYKEKLAQYGEEMKQHQDALGKYEQDKSAYEKALKDLEARKLEAKEKIQDWKTRIKLGIAGLGALLAGLIGLDSYKRSRPRLKGFLEDRSKPLYPKIYTLPRYTEPFNCSPFIKQSVILSPAKQGITLNGQVVRDGDQIAPDIYYHSTHPKRKSSHTRA